ncbi:hypothetical protein D3C85_827630 [compost metagenome]
MRMATTLMRELSEALTNCSPPVRMRWRMLSMMVSTRLTSMISGYFSGRVRTASWAWASMEGASLARLTPWLTSVGMSPSSIMVVTERNSSSTRLVARGRESPVRCRRLTGHSSR